MKIAVVIPCFRVKKHILDLIPKIPKIVTKIFIIDDACPEGSGDWVLEKCKDKRVQVIQLPQNLGVGGAVKTGYLRAMEEKLNVIVKLDGDGQMDPTFIPDLVEPILQGKADYAKGNRFYDWDYLGQMPKTRLLGNGFLSFLNKLVSGYWDIMDPTNGYTAIHASVLRWIPLSKINDRYFFESDMLFRLSTIRAVVKDVPIPAIYQGEVSSLRISRVASVFPFQYANRFFKRILYNYFLRDFNLGSVAIIKGTLLLGFGISFGLWHWIHGSFAGKDASSGTVMLAALPILLGFQLILFALQFDVISVPKRVLSWKDKSPNQK